MGVIDDNGIPALQGIFEILFQPYQGTLCLLGTEFRSGLGIFVEIKDKMFGLYEMPVVVIVGDLILPEILLCGKIAS